MISSGRNHSADKCAAEPHRSGNAGFVPGEVLIFSCGIEARLVQWQDSIRPRNLTHRKPLEVRGLVYLAARIGQNCFT